MTDYKTEDQRIEDEQLELIGDLITKVESILSPKPKSVWHLPGAQQRVLSSVLLILHHGCKEDSEGKPKLWSFIFGLRVIRPDLWPNYELKYSGGNISEEELVSLWLQISLQTHLLPSQLKALIGDRKRICTYYHPWAFIRSELHTSSLLIVLQALEHNSQDILARVNPSLMVKFYSKRKKDQQKEKFLVTENIIVERKSVNTSDTRGVTELLSVNSAIESRNSNENENHSFWEDETLSFTSSKISPSFFNVDYSSSVFSDSEKNDNSGQRSVCPKRASDKSVINYSCTTKSCSSPLSQTKIQEDAVISNIDENQSIEFSSHDRTFKDIKEVSYCASNNLMVQPTPFLLQYLESKSKYFLTQSSDFSQKNSSIKDIEDPTLRPPVPSVCIEDESNTISKYYGSSLENNVPPASSKPPRVIKKSKIFVNEKPKISATTAMPKRTHVRSFSDGVTSIVTDPTFSPVSTSFSDKSSSSLHISVKKSFMEDGGQSITPEADGFFPHPEPGQTLIDFLTSNQFAKASAQLDRENAHFSIAEAVLAALEQINYESSNGNGKDKRSKLVGVEESEDDTLHSKQLPSNRRKLRVRSTVLAFAKSSDDEPGTTDHSVLDSPEPQSSNSSDTETFSSLSELHNQVNVNELEASSSTDPSSAENVAIAILMHYNSRLLPKASDLQWLVSEQDVPQKLLPIPKSIPVSPDDAEGVIYHPLLRGTSDWAPPRPQLILTLHKNTKRKVNLQMQKWRCAGCGLCVSEKLSSHFRLCHYLGRYFCTSCHTNKKAVVPAKVLHNWDFKKYTVCNFSSELLSRMSPDPLFHLGSLNPRLYKQSRDLHQAHIYRLQLYHARVYIITCNRATKEREMLETYPHHWSTEPHVYSLDDLMSVKKGQIINQIKHLTTTLLTHVSKCQICLGQGFICEICREGSPIFPFQLDAVTQCTKCKECFHFLCFSPERPCPRCRRRDKREGDEEGASDR